jgi:uncharacterized phage protein (TIGR02218 family)
MKTVTQPLLDLLGAGQFHAADLWTLTLSSGAVLRYTTADVDVTANGKTFLASSHLFNRGRIVQKIGCEVDSLDAEVFPKPGDLVNGLPFLQAVRAGHFDAAEVLLERAFMPVFGDTSAGTITLFSGRMAEINAGRSSVSITANSHLELLNVKTPRAVYQASCPFTLYDTYCGAQRSAWETSASVGSGASHTVVPVALAGRGDDWATHGVLTFTSGACNGQTRTISHHAGGLLTIYPPLPAAPAAGDTVKVAPGCDKTWPEQTINVAAMTIPSTAPYQITIPGNIIGWGVMVHVPVFSDHNWKRAMWALAYKATLVPTEFTQVAGPPATGQYSYANGVYTFAAANAGYTASIVYLTLALTGCGKFRNITRFGGQPFIPQPEVNT